jgi:hypothetical protein
MGTHSVVVLLTALVRSVIRRLPNSLCPAGKNPWQDTDIGLSNVREREIQRGECLLLGTFKTYASLWEGGTR